MVLEVEMTYEDWYLNNHLQRWQNAECHEAARAAWDAAKKEAYAEAAKVAKTHSCGLRSVPSGSPCAGAIAAAIEALGGEGR